MTTINLGDLKEAIFTSQAKLAEVERRFQFAALEFQNSESSTTFSAMDDIRLERCGAQYELDCAIALMDEAVEEITGGTRDAAKREVSEKCDAWIDAHNKFEEAELAVHPTFQGGMETPEVKAWLEAMKAESIAEQIFVKAQSKLDAFEYN